MFSKLKERSIGEKDALVEKAKDYIASNKEAIKKKIDENQEIKNALLDKAAAAMSVALIAGFLYELLPMPVKWVVSEDTFVEFTEDNLDFLIESFA